ncbi:hypothetical protein BofuT4_uP008750.1 [Botrytis cinerea T4]|uniref:Uncharacterized protein n=1 Tax=Botryotinia fuckeliana (strain T4) TaxID=999810 RepID=G2XX80_BOTF4|nr:hypothetical protein BofuT4_uP008750.1 [Botrytis cinerea T4]
MEREKLEQWRVWRVGELETYGAAKLFWSQAKSKWRFWLVLGCVSARFSVPTKGIPIELSSPDGNQKSKGIIPRWRCWWY